MRAISAIRRSLCYLPLRLVLSRSSLSLSNCSSRGHGIPKASAALRWPPPALQGPPLPPMATTDIFAGLHVPPSLLYISLFSSPVIILFISIRAWYGPVQDMPSRTVGQHRVQFRVDKSWFRSHASVAVG